VTQKTVCSPTGMHGQNVAFGSGVTVCPLLPEAGLAQSRINAPVLVRNLFP